MRPLRRRPAVQPRAAAKRPITETDLYKFTWIADPQISPDAKTVAFVQVTVNEKDNKYESSLYSVPRGGRRAACGITGGHARHGAAVVARREVARVRAAEREGRRRRSHLLPMRGGEARALTDLPKGAGGPVWSPDGKTIAFTSTTVADDMKKPDPAAKPERKSDVKVVTRAVYRANGNPDLRRRRSPRAHLDGPGAAGELTARRPSAKAITSGDFDERGVQWSPDGATLYFVSDRVAEPYYNAGDSDLYSVPAAGGDDREGREHRRHRSDRSPCRPTASGSRSSAR